MKIKDDHIISIAQIVAIVLVMSFSVFLTWNGDVQLQRKQEAQRVNDSLKLELLKYQVREILKNEFQNNINEKAYQK